MDTSLVVALVVWKAGLLVGGSVHVMVVVSAAVLATESNE